VEWGAVAALVITVPLVLFPVAFVWYVSAGGIYSAITRREISSGKETNLQEQVPPDLVCSVDTDCPEGFMCVNGRCVPERTW